MIFILVSSLLYGAVMPLLLVVWLRQMLSQNTVT